MWRERVLVNNGTIKDDSEVGLLCKYVCVFARVYQQQHKERCGGMTNVPPWPYSALHMLQNFHYSLVFSVQQHQRASDLKSNERHL